MKIIKFSGNHCGQCKAYQRFYDQFKEKHPEITFEEVDAEENMEVAEKYHVRSLPTTVFVKSDGTWKSEYGILTVDRLENIIKEQSRS